MLISDFENNKILFEEADGVYTNIQGKDRPKSRKKLEMKVAVSYEGWKEVGKDKYELVNKIACVGFEEALEYIQILADSVEDEKEKKKLRELYRYFNNNKEGLILYQSRGLEIPEPHNKDIMYRTLGTIEHHICDIIAQRIRNKKANWGIEGAGNLGKILAAKTSKKLHQIIKQYTKITLSEEKSREIIEILSAAKAPKKDGKGKDGNTHKGQKSPLTIAIIQVVKINPI